MESSKPLKIADINIYGRDMIDLEELIQKNNTLHVIIEFDIEAQIRQKEIVFKKVLFYSSMELDTYEASTVSSSWLTQTSNFEEITHSTLLSKYVNIRSDYQKEDYKHYRISTYDYIIEVVSKNYIIL
jgi:hypothetical protein